MKNKGGRPPLYSCPIELDKKIEQYFKNCPDKRPVYNKYGEQIAEVPEYTITGLVLYLGFCNRASFYDMEKRPEFSNTIKKARTLIENVYEKLLQRGLGAGAIFALKNFGWIDKNLDDKSDDRLENELEFVGVQTKGDNGRLKKFYN